MNKLYTPAEAALLYLIDQVYIDAGNLTEPDVRALAEGTSLDDELTGLIESGIVKFDEDSNLVESPYPASCEVQGV